MVRPLRRLCDRMAFRWLRSRQTSRVGSTPFRACHPVWSIYPVWSLSGIFDIRLPPCRLLLASPGGFFSSSSISVTLHLSPSLVISRSFHSSFPRCWCCMGDP
ncbi:hypothetical protein M752DRAFT_144985 [Aspergillus phoenicis ATCC 13157]|uniref:Uncharacterized protein n=1 Tax=Aspergillus phoenicis ATCC 13157 TaxID=1353007 RepID=A0A370PNM6_ASPPH|nr:hypothetical protein M752DRAFT_144985 [Aspergillus phoenicis ATCC 13157]